MNRNNIWIHVGIAAIVITMAAVLGQIGRWEASLDTKFEKFDPAAPPMPVNVSRTAAESEPEVLVRFKPGVSLDRIRSIALRNHDVMEDEIESVNGLTFIDDLDNADAEDVAKQYAAMSEVVSYAEPNFRIELDDPAQIPTTHDLLDREFPVIRPNDPEFENQWALFNLGREGAKERADIDAPGAWTKTKGSEDVVVAVLDTGVDYSHPDLRSNIWLRPDDVPEYVDDELGVIDDSQGFDADATDADPMDDNGHGTHCAGIIGAEGDNNEGIAGINWHVQIMPLKFLGRGGFGSTAKAIEAINYAIDRKKHGVNIRVINASWGSTQYSKALEDAIRAAGDAGILFVAAAGNNGTDNDKHAHYPSNYNLPNLISVAATDNTDNLTSFSNFGVKRVHIAAPGRDIESTWLNDDYREASGTSMAAPQVSGVAALILAVEPKISVEKLRERILKSVDKIDSLAGKVENGGRLNAAKALGE
ncbi:MAG TPA: S8 family serine peptidase [Pyrinomonadaceae bacterium]|jgi:subtilisin family serine protease|nr:S8 family serine peptidase [Pyrinomonadaceae bacterium]